MHLNKANLNFLNHSSFIKFSGVFFLFFVFLFNPGETKNLLSKSEILRESKECLEDFNYELCRNLILELEKIQLLRSDQNRYKCQASILGLQTELVEAYSFKKVKNSKKGIMIPYVIKNC